MNSPLEKRINHLEERVKQRHAFDFHSKRESQVSRLSREELGAYLKEKLAQPVKSPGAISTPYDELLQKLRQNQKAATTVKDQ